MPRENNSRTKDLVDIYLLVKTASCDLEKLWHALKMTFERRKTHPIPEFLSPPPKEWAVQFSVLARDVGIETDYSVVFKFVLDWYKHLLKKSTDFH